MVNPVNELGDFLYRLIHDEDAARGRCFRHVDSLSSGPRAVGSELPLVHALARTVPDPAPASTAPYEIAPWLYVGESPGASG